MEPETGLEQALGPSWSALLDHLGDAVLVVDRGRTLRLVNRAARHLLGYQVGDELGGRCRALTRGLDCETACPVSFAEREGLEVVEGFAAEYRDRQGRSVAVTVTAVLLRDERGQTVGHVEILRPRSAGLGFFLAGSSLRVAELRRRVDQLARSGRHLALVGEGPAGADVARAVHRLAGLPAELLLAWSGSWQGVPAWPPGTMVAGPETVAEAVSGAPPGWRVVAVAGRVDELPALLGLEVVELPGAEARRDDLPAMVAAWVGQLRPGLEVAPAALEELCATAVEHGLTALARELDAAAAVAGDRLEAADLHPPGDAAGLAGDVLAEPDPLAAAERRLLEQVLERCGWRMQEAADRLGISRVTLWRKLREHGIGRACCASSQVSGSAVKR